jgi:hypothetical protein
VAIQDSVESIRLFEEFHRSVVDACDVLRVSLVNPDESKVKMVMGSN